MRTEILTLALLSVPLAAQGSVVPSWLATSPGSGTTNYPFGLGTACRMQYLYEAGETGLAGPKVVTSFDVRAKQDLANAAKANIDLQIEMSQTPVLMAGLSSTFAANRGPNHTVVFARRLVALPATPAQVIGPWTPAFVLDAPFVYDPTGGDSLLIEYDVASQPTATWQVDCAWSAAGVHSAIGTGCNGVTASSSGGQLGGSLTIGCAGGSANAAGALIIGATEWPTPIPVPGSPTCFSYSSFEVVLAVTASATGTVSQNFPVPNLQGLLGAPLHGQFALVSPAFSIDTSPSRRMFLTDLDQVGRVYNLTSNTLATGSTQARVALVTRLH